MASPGSWVVVSIPKRGVLMCKRAGVICAPLSLTSETYVFIVGNLRNRKRAGFTRTMLKFCRMSEKVPAEFLLTTFEYRVIFADPIFAAFEKPTAIADILYHTLSEWNPTFDNI